MTKEQLKAIHDKLEALQQTDEATRNAFQHFALAMNSQADVISSILKALEDHEIAVDLPDSVDQTF